MVGFLRALRGFLGFVFILQVAGVMPAVLGLAQIDGAVLAQLVFKIIVGAICAWLFFWMRGVINAKHLIKSPLEPAPLRTAWML